MSQVSLQEIVVWVKLKHSVNFFLCKYCIRKNDTFAYYCIAGTWRMLLLEIEIRRKNLFRAKLYQSMLMSWIFIAMQTCVIWIFPCLLKMVLSKKWVVLFLCIRRSFRRLKSDLHRRMVYCFWWAIVKCLISTIKMRLHMLHHYG